MTFAFIHISDLHFDTENVSVETFRKEVKEKIKMDKLSADCLIISGDLFNRGKLNREDSDRCDEFLRDIPGRGFTVVVPGNHDLDRSSRHTEEESYNVFLTRKQLVLSKGNEAFSEGQFSLNNNDEKKILYKSAYEAFFTFSRQMGFKSFMQKDPNLAAEFYEVQVVSNSFENFPCKINFVLLNTGLIAGQSVSGDDYRERKELLKKEFNKATDTGDYVKAAEIQVELAKQQKRFENDGELIIDEEYQDESGRLSLSRDGISILSNDINAADMELTIFVGHHGNQFLSSETKKALKQAMRKCKSGIYLCGHAHRVRYERFKIGNNTIPKDIEQIQAGVMFKDEGGYTQYGFDHGVFSVGNNNDIVCSITSYFLTESASGDLLWMSETIDIPLNGIRIPSTTENVLSHEQDVDNRAIPNPEVYDDQRPTISHMPPENPPSVNGPVSTEELRKLFNFNKQPSVDSEKNKKE